MEKDRFVMLYGVLYRVRLVVPEVLRMQLMEEVHSGSFSDHFVTRARKRAG